MLEPGIGGAADAPPFTSPARTCDFLSASLMPIRARPPEGSGSLGNAIFLAASSAAASSRRRLRPVRLVALLRQRGLGLDRFQQLAQRRGRFRGQRRQHLVVRLVLRDRAQLQIVERAFPAGDEIAAVAVEQFGAEPLELVFDAALLAGVAHHPVLALQLGGDRAELLEEEIVEAGIAVEAGYLQLRRCRCRRGFRKPALASAPDCAATSKSVRPAE